MVQAHNAISPVYNNNIDVAAINVGKEDLSRHKVVVVPGLCLIDKASADNIRQYVRDGATVVMTAMSAKVNETNQWSNSHLPGYLSDVFWVKTREFYHRDVALSGQIGAASVNTTIHFYEVLEPTIAAVLGRFSNVEGMPPVATIKSYGKGQAIYVATPVQPSVLQPLKRSLYGRLGIPQRPATPEGVYARVVNGLTLSVKAAYGPKDIPIEGTKTGLLSGKTWSGTLHLETDGGDIV